MTAFLHLSLRYQELDTREEFVFLSAASVLVSSSSA